MGDWGRLEIVALNVPAVALPGEQFPTTVTIQFMDSGIRSVYGRVRDLRTGGIITDTPKYSDPSGYPLGSMLDLSLEMREGFWMPDYPWNLQVEVGVAYLGYLGQPADKITFTVYTEQPPQECPEGHYWDPVKEACIRNPSPPIDPITGGVILLMVVVAAGSYYYSQRKKRR